MTPSEERVDIIATIDNDNIEHVGHNFIMRNGAVLAMRKVNPQLIGKALEKIEEPKIPIVHIEDKETYEENPADPDYMKAINEYNAKRGVVVQDTYLALGCVVKETPEGISSPDDDGWIADSEFLGIKVTNKDSKIARHLQWLYFTLSEVFEMQALTQCIMVYNDVMQEEDVLKAMRSFRHPEESRGDNTGADTEESSDRRELSEFDPGSDERVRAERSSNVLPINMEPVPFPAVHGTSGNLRPL